MYYTLVERDEYGMWWPQFGDYDKRVVTDEMEDCYNPNICKIVSTPTDQQSDIDVCVDIIWRKHPTGIFWSMDELLALGRKGK